MLNNKLGIPEADGKGDSALSAIVLRPIHNYTTNQETHIYESAKSIISG